MGDQQTTDELVASLREELETVSQENRTAAQFGLELIQKNQNLETEIEELKDTLHVTKQELEEFKSNYTSLRSEQQKRDIAGFQAEADLIDEGLSKEEIFQSNISKAEKQLGHKEGQVAKLKEESEKLNQTNQELQFKLEAKGNESSKLKKELKELQKKEDQIMNEFADLEAENVSLQTQVTSLRQKQLAVDELQHENNRLCECVAELQMQVEDVTGLKNIFEKKHEEALEALQIEREQRQATKREYEGRLASQADEIYERLAVTGAENVDDSEEMETSGTNQSILFEMHREELHKLESQMKETNSKLEEAKSQVKTLTSSLDEKNALLTKYETSLKFRLSVDDADADLKVLLPDDEYNDGINEIQDLSELRRRLRISMSKSNDLELSLALMKKEGKLSDSQQELVIARKQVYQYSHKLAQLERQLSQARATSNDTEGVDLKNLTRIAQDLEVVYETLCQGGEYEKIMFRGELGDSKKLVEVIGHQIKNINGALQRKPSNGVPPSNPSNGALSNGGGGDYNGLSAQELAEQLVRAKAMLSTKREQITTLRAHLQQNKQIAETALTRLTGKYETEKRNVSETMAKLHAELKMLKEDAATFASLRATFAQRCDEYVTQVDELQRAINASEENNKQLSSLLKLSIEQKLKLSQKLETMECAREMRMSSATAVPSTGVPPLSNTLTPRRGSQPGGTPSNGSNRSSGRSFPRPSWYMHR